MSHKILIADDEEDIQAMVRMYLESKGYETVVAFDGLDALDQAKKHMPDLILLDIMMPVLDGFEVCRRLKADPGTERIPVVMVSASSQSESMDRAAQAGAIDYLSKPFEPEAMDAVLARLRK